MRRSIALLLLLPACAHRAPTTAPATVARVALAASSHEIDSLWTTSLQQFHTGQFAKAQTGFERLTLEFAPGDNRSGKAHFYMAECYLAQKENLQAAREFRRVSDETPNDELAPQALLRAGDSYADLWRRPELDPTYGQTALATYQELLTRYPASSASKRAQARILDLQERFAYKSYQAAQYYFKFKAYDSAILYLKDLIATYPKSRIAPQALVRLVQAYRVIGYQEDLKETCGYLRRFHPDAPHADEVCPKDAAGTS